MYNNLAMKVSMETHNWSGKFNRFCVDCGIEDVTEFCIVEHPRHCTTCVNPPCSMKGSNRYNPDLKIDPSPYEVLKFQKKDKDD